MIHESNGMDSGHDQSIAFQVFDRVMVLDAQVLMNKPFHGFVQTRFV